MLGSQLHSDFSFRDSQEKDNRINDFFFFMFCFRDLFFSVFFLTIFVFVCQFFSCCVFVLFW